MENFGPNHNAENQQWERYLSGAIRQVGLPSFQQGILRTSTAATNKRLALALVWCLCETAMDAGQQLGKEAGPEAKAAGEK